MSFYTSCGPDSSALGISGLEPEAEYAAGVLIEQLRRGAVGLTGRESDVRLERAQLSWDAREEYALYGPASVLGHSRFSILHSIWTETRHTLQYTVYFCVAVQNR